MADILLFSYGTLRQREVQIALFGRPVEGIADAIPGFRQRMIEITDPDVIARSGTRWHPMVEPSDDPADAVEGLLFRLTPQDIASADAYEVDYVRREVTLRSGLTAFVYGDRDAPSPA
ncbi:gamma-glutamylcyclotransferase family protein [Sphingobium sp. YR768]|uniref:gamma-glutamylcyclotransferase family protein n=1 Tax=Sphingobium sp. YR768 TaxID=1884365 RepID=UPI0008D8864B|nr:gamma-glutamylcyclotransferase family protein [Sphingobium sp. YR768]SER77303.1 Gamma-glutamyl cyclotransferase, AIG2-like [Sphingobium sp. YR768]